MNRFKELQGYKDIDAGKDDVHDQADYRSFRHDKSPNPFVVSGLKKHTLALDTTKPADLTRKGSGLCSISQANKKLRFGISLLRKNSPCKQSFQNALSDAIETKKELEQMGMPWQVQKLEIWINKARKKKEFL